MDCETKGGEKMRRSFIGIYDGRRTRIKWKNIRAIRNLRIGLTFCKYHQEDDGLTEYLG